MVNLMRSPAMNSFTRDKTPTLSWHKPADMEQAQLEISGDEAFSNILVHVDMDGKQGSYTAVGLDYQKYYWRIQVMQAGTWSGWLPAGSFTITPGVARPMLLTPVNGAVVDTNMPTFTWRAIPSNLSGLDNHYEIQIDASRSFGSPDQSLTSDTAMVTVGALAPGRYYWRVRTINGLGYASRWSAPRTFVVR